MWFVKWPPPKRVVALALCALLWGLGVGSSVLDVIDKSTDPETIAKLYTTLRGVSIDAVPVTLLDVDSDTREAWSAPVKVPHSSLAQLILVAKINGAKAIIVDFDLSSEGSDQRSDPVLSEVLKSYHQDDPLLLLARRVTFDSAEDRGIAIKGSATTPYDSIIQDKKNIFWITTLNDVGNLRSVKGIRLWQSLCDNPRESALPSAALLVAGQFIRGEAYISELKTFLSEIAKHECLESRITWPYWIGPKQARIAIPFAVPDQPSKMSMIEVDTEAGQNWGFYRIPARMIANQRGEQLLPVQGVSPFTFTDRVVIIGSTDFGNGDFYDTPLGIMPGALILANSLLQAPSMLRSTEPHYILSTFFTVLLFLLFLYLLKTYETIAAALFVVIVVCGVLVISSRLFSVDAGLSVIASSLLGLAILGFVESVIDLAISIRRKGWRALYKLGKK